MKYYLLILILVSAILGFFIYEAYSSCFFPISYEVGSVSNRFGISKEDFLSSIKEAEAIWEKGGRQDLFKQETGGKLKINLVFDERQAQTVAANQSKEKIDDSKASYDILLGQYKVKELSYENRLRAYNARAKDFEQTLSTYNQKVAEINSKGGASQDTYDQLEKERQQIKRTEDSLDIERINLNTDASELNKLSEDVNSLGQKLNINVELHNNRFGEAREFDQGEYTKNTINIYQFETRSDLKLVLAHEFGHALNINHVENPKSIMYYLMDKQDLKNPGLTSEDKTALNLRCELRIPKLQNLFK